VARKRIVVIGAGGFARETKWLISEVNNESDIFEFVGYVVSEMRHIGPYDAVDDIIGDFSWLAANRNDIDALAMGIGSPKPRLRLSHQIEHEIGSFEWPPLIHPSVHFDRASCHFGHGVQLCPGTVATVDVTVAPFSLVNLSCTLGHEANLGRGCVLQPTVNVSGGVQFGEGVLVGTGAQILQYLSIGEGARVGAGAVVTKDVPPGATVVGVPAKPLVTEASRLAVIGAGGHAQVVISTARASGWNVVAVLDDDPAKLGTRVLGAEVLGPVNQLGKIETDAAVIAIGDNAARKEIASRIDADWATIVAPSASVDASVVIGPGTVVFAGAVIQPDTVLGQHAIVNTGATVDHRCKIGDFAHVCPGANLTGEVEADEGALLGTNASLKPRVRVGAWATVGAGGVVVHDVPPGVTAVGVPARPVEDR
jgi:sugar O-acyltransferase (sialic acid O-acetyltransferase NeuD family)